MEKFPPSLFSYLPLAEKEPILLSVNNKLPFKPTARVSLPPSIQHHAQGTGKDNAWAQSIKEAFRFSLLS